MSIRIIIIPTRNEMKKAQSNTAESTFNLHLCPGTLRDIVVGSDRKDALEEESG